MFGVGGAPFERTAGTASHGKRSANDEPARFGRSVGAAANTPRVRGPGGWYRIDEDQTVWGKPFAGRDTGVPIREVDRLVPEFGGDAAGWSKMKADIRLVREADGVVEVKEVHWYEHWSEEGRRAVDWKYK